MTLERPAYGPAAGCRSLAFAPPGPFPIDETKRMAAFPVTYSGKSGLFVGFVKDAFTTFAFFISFALLRDAWAVAPVADARGGARQQGPMDWGLLGRMASCIKKVWHLHK